MDSIYIELMKFDMYMEHFSFANRFNGLKDMSKINVYIGDTSIIRTSQHADYTASDLLSDLGGIMGLWIGMSVLSVAELLQLIFDLCKTVNGKNEQKKKRSWVEPLSISR